MALTDYASNRVLISGHKFIEDESAASAIITPGFLVEKHLSSSVLKIRPNSSDVNMPTMAVAIERTELNKGIDDNYAVGDQVKFAWLHPGSEFQGIVPSGSNIAVDDHLQSNGDGKLKAATASTAAAGVARFQAVTSSGGAVTKDTRLRVLVIS
jgi:hypothetical protein